MLDHVSLGVSDLERSRRFYDAVLRPLVITRMSLLKDRCGTLPRTSGA
jgi:catechol 2,3-dioxygenase-like lactoylglutathione lyase family enzyme